MQYVLQYVEPVSEGIRSHLFIFCFISIVLRDLHC